MALDNQIFAQANKPSVEMADPNVQLGQMAAAQNAVNQNKLFQSQAARGALMQQAIDPSTGQFNPAQFNRLMSQDPRAALSAPQAVGQSQELMGSQYDLAAKRNDFLSSAIGAALKAPDDQIHQIALDSLSRGVDMGLLTPQDAIKQGLLLSNNPTGLRQQLQQIQMSRMGPQNQRDATYGTPSTRDTGLGIESGTVAPQDQGSGFRPTTTTDVYPGRAQQAGRVQVGMNPDGSPIMGPAANVTPPYLAGPVGQSQFGNGRLPPALRNPNRPAAAPQGAPAGAPSAPPATPQAAPPRPSSAPPVANNGEVTTGLGPAQTAAQATTGTQSAAAFKDIADQGVAAQSRGAVLDNMLSDTKQFASGPGTDQILRLRQVAGRLGLNPSTDATSAAESFNKLAAQLASQQGGGTDARLNVAQAGNPHGDLSPEGLDQMLRQLRGNEDYLSARSQLADAYPNKGDRSGFESKQGSQLDPRTFQYDRLTPAQKATYFKNIDNKAAFVKAHDAAARMLGRGQ